jgi:hypothetical protein
MSDKNDKWTEAIDAAHPLSSGSHEQWAIAMEMVGNRHSKGALVELVNWLLVRDRACSLCRFNPRSELCDFCKRSM